VLGAVRLDDPGRLLCQRGDQRRRPAAVDLGRGDQPLLEGGLELPPRKAKLVRELHQAVVDGVVGIGATSNQGMPVVLLRRVRRGG
jgi:hypothetical protein